MRRALLALLAVSLAALCGCEKPHINIGCTVNESQPGGDPKAKPAEEPREQNVFQITQDEPIRAEKIEADGKRTQEFKSHKDDVLIPLPLYRAFLAKQASEKKP